MGGGSGGDAAWRQVSHLLVGCWELHQSNAVLPEMGVGPSCLAGSETGEEGHGMCPRV